MKTPMKSALAIAGVASVLVAAAPASAQAWYCYASSSHAYGWANNYSLRRAKRAALYQCAIRTRRGYYCRIRYCR